MNMRKQGEINHTLWELFMHLTQGMDHGERAAAATFILACVMAHCEPKPGHSDEGFVDDLKPLLVEQCQDIRDHIKKYGGL